MHAHHIRAREIKVGDIVLTPLASNPRVIFTEPALDVWEYEERLNVCSTGNYLQFGLEDTVTVLRPEEA
ncbi:hypothetical protein 40AC_89 [Mycobacterium phage 40AC]|uniref:Uncharacterized protein n=1 Tax=Mycobacterium phage 40AC TaxID=1458717 RepID=W8ECP1_9CAUD|nr:hypothetical protein ST40AC_89 [Mycobacterium phage 40AC]AHJ86452.1 hypothetical protein 40AC_89 [Mycobacterium phage 40AC]